MNFRVFYGGRLTSVIPQLYICATEMNIEVFMSRIWLPPRRLSWASSKASTEKSSNTFKRRPAGRLPKGPNTLITAQTFGIAIDLCVELNCVVDWNVSL